MFPCSPPISLSAFKCNVGSVEKQRWDAFLPDVLSTSDQRWQKCHMVSHLNEETHVPISALWWQSCDASHSKIWSALLKKNRCRLADFPQLPQNSKPFFNLSAPLHLHLHFMTGRDLISVINTRSRLSPEFNQSIYSKERTPVPNLSCSECTSLLIHTPHHPLSLISHQPPAPPLPPPWLPQASPSLIKA